jgi:hypothetical protein
MPQTAVAWFGYAILCLAGKNDLADAIYILQGQVCVQRQGQNSLADIQGHRGLGHIVSTMEGRKGIG